MYIQYIHEPRNVLCIAQLLPHLVVATAGEPGSTHQKCKLLLWRSSMSTCQPESLSDRCGFSFGKLFKEYTGNY